MTGVLMMFLLNTSNNMDIKFIGDREIKTVVTSDLKTPMLAPVYLVTYIDGKSEFVSQLLYDLVMTPNKSDSTTVREILVRKIGGGLFGYLNEFGLSLSELDPVLDEVVRLVNDCSDKATNILWGVEHPKLRNLLMVNQILMKNFKEENAREESTNGTAPTGGVADPENKG